MLSLKVDGTKIRRLRERRGLTVAAVAAAAGCSKWQIYKIESGRVQPSATVYAGMRQVLEADESELITEGAAA
ncbi:helix-turn-helix domain-containing protein [Streptomyces sp. NPDC101132]|uniref:helix-turn-helix domain-containing protein n=1 Tax=Streptomyces sp. NPDC101132 TaxID=3366110 RepID=UPI00382E04A4